MEGNVCEVTWETIAPMRGDPVSYVLQVLVGRESEYKQVSYLDTHTCMQTCRHTRQFAFKEEEEETGK